MIYDLEVEKTARKLRKETRNHKDGQSSTASHGLNLATVLVESSTDYSSDSGREENTMTNNKTLRELAAPELTQQSLCIIFSNLAENTSFELKSGLIHLLPFFQGLSGEEPHRHLQEFNVVYSSMKPSGVTEEQIKFRVFPFSLKDAAKD